MATARGVDPFLKADLLTRTPKRHEQSLHRRAPGFSPSDTGVGSHMSYELTRNGRSQTAAHEACNRPAVISTPSSSLKPAGERVDRHARNMQPHHGCAPFWLCRIRRSSMEASATCHVTGAPVTTCKETAPPHAPMPRLLDCRTSVVTRGSPARDPTVPIKCNDHGSLSRGDRHGS
jgi:hypothetical protein